MARKNKFEVFLKLNVERRDKKRIMALARKVCGKAWDIETGRKLSPEEQICDLGDAVFELVNANPLFEKGNILIKDSAIAERWRKKEASKAAEPEGHPKLTVN